MTGTRPKLSWSDLSGARVGLWGLGREGLANLRKLCAMGIEPVLVDDRPPALAIGGSPVLTTGYGGLAALEKCDVVVKSPGISRYRPEVVRLEERGVPVAGGLGLWLQEADLTRVLLITGTKGKSTTAAVTGHLLTGLGHRCLVGGNIGQPPWDPDCPSGPAGGTGPLGLLGHRGLQLPGHRPVLLDAGGGRYLAAPRSPRLARRRAELLSRQAVRVLPAGGGSDRRQR